MLKESIEKKLNEQVEKEGYSSQLYLAMASWAETLGFKGISTWLFAQSDEERKHMLKLVKYINERGGKATIPLLKEPPLIYDGIKPLFEQILKHERFISESIHGIVELCNHEKDYTTLNWIQWFVQEQIEEESQVKDILDKLNLMGDRDLLYIFDRDIMGMRQSSH
ncbi:ferritin [Bacteroidota bacterium]